MGCNPKVFQRMTPAQKQEYMRKVTRLYLHQLLAHGVGLVLMGLCGLVLVCHHLLTK
ncbi:MAG: hypothetical protein GAK37_00296 [Pseudomonas sp.]|nr:MAG: hypothetical protein GAK37_00296 [Pseudomonas sp.]